MPSKLNAMLSCSTRPIAPPLLAFLLLAPAPRAWFYTLRGDYEAARICEKTLARHPHRVSLYLKLANLYLLAGRRDRRAMTAYAMMRLLRLVFRRHEESDIYFKKYCLQLE